MNIIDMFETGMDRHVPEFISPEQGLWLNLGAGNKKLPNCVNLDRPMWEAPYLDYHVESVDAVFAFHFLEHLNGEFVIHQLREIERVLKPGGTFTCLVPHWSCEMAHQDLDHRSFWSETTWDNLLKNPYYEHYQPRDWKLYVHSCVIMGLVSRNLAVLTQLVKSGATAPDG